MSACTCAACRLGHDEVVLPAAHLAKHLNLSLDDFRASVRAGEGPPAYRPAHCKRVRYYLPAAKAWLSARNDQRKVAS